MSTLTCETSNFRDLLVSEWAPYGTLNDDQLSKLERHYGLLTRWNRTLNLTRAGDLEDLVRFHYCESLFLGSVLPPTQSIADVGSGGGFPGIPIGISRTDCTVSLFESHRRKCVFLREAIEGVSNIEVVEARAEAASRSFDWLISRGVALEEVLALRFSKLAAVLTSVDNLEGIEPPYEVIQVPWGRQRIIAKFHVKHRPSVPRGTSRPAEPC